MKNNFKVSLYMRVGSIEQLDGQLEDVHIPGKMDINRKDVLIYCRVARNDNDEIDHQRNRLVDYAYDKGFYVKGIFEDIGSGLNFNRKGLKALLTAIEKRSIDYILVKDVTRIGREVLSTLQLIDRLDKKNVKVFCADLGQEHQLEILSGLIEEYIASKAEKRKKHHITKYDVFGGAVTVNR